MKQKFTVWGTYCEIIASCDVECETEEEAIDLFDATFTQDQRAGLIIEVLVGDDSWQEGRSSYSGMYDYHIGSDEPMYDPEPEYYEYEYDY